MIPEREKDIVNGEGGDIVRRFTPGASASVEENEIVFIPEPDVTRMKVAVDLGGCLELAGGGFEPPTFGR